MPTEKGQMTTQTASDSKAMKKDRFRILHKVSVLDKELTQKELENIARNAKDHMYVHGLVMRTPKSPCTSECAEYAPFTLFPSMVPQHLIDQVKSIQKDFNRLFHKVALDKAFLYQCFKNVLDIDDFTKKLWDIYCSVEEEGLAQPILLGLFRNDFMMDTKHAKSLPKDLIFPDDIQMKQVEFNTIASGSAGLATKLPNIHRYSLKYAGKTFDKSQVPDNNAVQGLADGMITAWERYGNERSVIIFLVNAAEILRFDQRWHEEYIFQRNKSVRVLYRTLEDMVERSELTEDKVLKIDGFEVAVLYFRTGYSPSDYRSQAYWETRLQMERSKAIKSPSVHHQLAGAKKVQQELCRPGAVERYITDKTTADAIRKTFVQLFSLDLDEDGDVAAAKALREPHHYVLKPNREGGGNNLYGDEVRRFLLEKRDSPERAGYILMERIYPWPQRNCFVKVGGNITVDDVTSEIGVFGVYIGTADIEIENSEVGLLMKSKYVESDEGGICKGYGCIDTPFLI